MKNSGNSPQLLGLSQPRPRSRLGFPGCPLFGLSSKGYLTQARNHWQGGGGRGGGRGWGGEGVGGGGGVGGVGVGGGEGGGGGEGRGGEGGVAVHETKTSHQENK